MIIDFLKFIFSIFKTKTKSKSKTQLLRDYRDYWDLGITFEEYLEFVDSDNHIDIIVFFGFFILFVGIFIYRKIWERRLRLQGRPRAN